MFYISNFSKHTPNFTYIILFIKLNYLPWLLAPFSFLHPQCGCCLEATKTLQLVHCSNLLISYCLHCIIYHCRQVSQFYRIQKCEYIISKSLSEILSNFNKIASLMSSNPEWSKLCRNRAVNAGDAFFKKE